VIGDSNGRRKETSKTSGKTSGKTGGGSKESREETTQGFQSREELPQVRRRREACRAQEQAFLRPLRLFRKGLIVADASVRKFFLPVFISSIFCILVHFYGALAPPSVFEFPAYALGFIIALGLVYRFLKADSALYFTLATAILFPLTFFLDSFYVLDLHIALIAISAYLLWQRSLSDTLKSIGFPGNLKKNLLIGVLGFIGMLLAAILLTNIFVYLTGNLADVQKIAHKVTDFPLYVLLAAVFIAPLSEELFFRAFLSTRYGVWVSSALFAVSHLAYGSITELVGAFLLGLAFAFVYRYAKSITPCLVMHFLYNLAALIAIGAF